MPCFQAVHAVVAEQQQIAVFLGDVVISIRFVGINFVILGGQIADDGVGQNRQVVHAGQMLGRGQAGGVFKIGLRHAQALGFIVHHFGKRFFAARNALGKRNRGIVARHHNQAAHQIPHGHFAVRFEKHPRAFHFPCFFGHGELLLGLQFAFFQRFERQISGHQFGERCGLDLLVGVLGNQRLIALQIAHQIGGGGDFRLL